MQHGQRRSLPGESAAGNREILLGKSRRQRTNGSCRGRVGAGSGRVRCRVPPAGDWPVTVLVLVLCRVCLSAQPHPDKGLTHSHTHTQAPGVRRGGWAFRAARPRTW